MNQSPRSRRVTQIVSRIKQQQQSIEDFEIVGELGKGAYATTFEVRNKRDQSTIVLKEISKSRSPPEHVLQEAEILRHLQSRCDPYILCYVGFFEDETNYYIMTEFLGDYIPLDKFIRATKNPSTRWRAFPHLLASLVDGLHQIHEANVAHNDIKPANILVNPATLTTKYIDFGLACEGNGCAGNRVGGTRDYMSPEIHLEKLPDPVTGKLRTKRVVTVPLTLRNRQRADVFSLGVTLEEFIVGNINTVAQMWPRNPNRGKWLPAKFVQAYPVEAADLRFMLEPDPSKRRLPVVEAVPRGVLK
jgi:serine/threonine protein kinase